MIVFDIFNKATIKKEYLKDGIKYLELTYYDEDINKLYVFNMSYKRYLLQKYLGYLIPSNHKVIPLDKNEENFDIYNLGIRDEDNESPVYKGWKIVAHKKDKSCYVLSKDGKYQIKKKYAVETEIELGRQKLFGETFLLKNKEIFKIPQNILLNSLYPNCVIRGPWKNNKNTYVYIKNVLTKKRFKIAYAKYLYQEHIQRLLFDDEYVVLKLPNVYKIENMILKKVQYFKSNLYKNCKHIRGPYIGVTSDRLYLVIYYSKKKYDQISYSKFLMQEHIGRFLTKDEVVHHKDGDYFNNDISNLKLLTNAEHFGLDTVRLKEPLLICQVCGKEFILHRSRRNNIDHALKKNNFFIGPFCGISCINKAKKTPDRYKNILPEKEYFNLSKTYINKIF